MFRSDGGVCEAQICSRLLILIGCGRTLQKPSHRCMARRFFCSPGRNCRRASAEDWRQTGSCERSKTGGSSLLEHTPQSSSHVPNGNMNEPNVGNQCCGSLTTRLIFMAQLMNLISRIMKQTEIRRSCLTPSSSTCVCADPWVPTQCLPSQQGA